MNVELGDVASAKAIDPASTRARTSLIRKEVTGPVRPEMVTLDVVTCVCVCVCVSAHACMYVYLNMYPPCITQGGRSLDGSRPGCSSTRATPSRRRHKARALPETLNLCRT